ncbi:hypothetical protein K458DRAFT_66878 [Lentithecium fluviatile CBS 122367]|uniref:Uncharacterized protein n=1 Tax=Lentithecium fluviatile CBS 122367 TaxID=1168545 RepID=A0A6G1JLS0_9PLEO|nr:hypothetical protein K458DRAFT_66878 [Lentithecium fluviatile CBS 122367]
MATFIHHARFHSITPIIKAPTGELLKNVLERTRRELTVLPEPSKIMDDICTVLAYALDIHKKNWGVTRGAIPLALLLLWRFRYAREDGKGRDEKGNMAEDHIWVITAVARAITIITDAEVNLMTWSELTGINKPDLRAAFTAFDNALEHRFLATEAQ